MDTSRDDSRRVCGHCGKPLPGRVGGGRRAGYCNRSCQMKAFRARKHAGESSRNDSERDALTARAITAEAEAAALREQLAAARGRIGELAGELETLCADAAARGKPKTSTPSPVAASAPRLPPQIRLSTPRQCTQVGDTAWTVSVGKVRIGSIRQVSSRYWPTLPNGFEVYLGSTANTLEEAADKLALGYNGWANYWHAEIKARLTLLKPRQDGSRTAKWGSTVVGRVGTAEEAGLGGDGWFAYPKGEAVLRDESNRGPGLRFPTPQAAAEAMLAHWRTKNPPPWGELRTAMDTQEGDDSLDGGA